MKHNSAGSIHALGSGKFCSYERGADIIQMFGSPYSATDLGSLFLEPEHLRRAGITPGGRAPRCGHF